jgi:hypothetical protein
MPVGCAAKHITHAAFGLDDARRTRIAFEPASEAEDLQAGGYLREGYLQFHRAKSRIRRAKFFGGAMASRDQTAWLRMQF